jgi:hypothetical protein
MVDPQGGVLPKAGEGANDFSLSQLQGRLSSEGQLGQVLEELRGKCGGAVEIRSESPAIDALLRDAGHSASERSYVKCLPGVEEQAAR